jgi:hypothetical protein
LHLTRRFVWDRLKALGKILKAEKTDPSQIFRNQYGKLHENARPHFAKTTQQIVENLGWEVLSHPAYSSDYYLFRSMQHFLSEKTFQDIESVRKEVAQYFASETVNFFEMVGRFFFVIFL